METAKRHRPRPPPRRLWLRTSRLHFTAELLQNKSVSDPTYARMLAKFGEQGVVDTTGLVGYYSTLAMILNVARSPAQPDSTAPKLAPFPR